LAASASAVYWKEEEEEEEDKNEPKQGEKRVIEGWMGCTPGC